MGEKSKKINKHNEVYEKEANFADNPINDGKEEISSPEIDFPAFIFSLNSSALVHLGVLSDPLSGVKSANLILAKYTIDTISMLIEKTKGNLTKEESKMVLDVVYNLRLLYLKAKA